MNQRRRDRGENRSKKRGEKVRRIERRRMREKRADSQG